MATTKITSNVLAPDAAQNNINSGTAFNVTVPTTISNSLIANNLVYKGGNTEGATLTIGTNDAQPLNFETNNAQRMSITSNGNVGIGTTTPNEKLTVVGNISATGSVSCNSAVIPTLNGDSSFSDNLEVLGALTAPNQGLDENSGIITKGLLGLSSIINPLIFIINDNPVTDGLNFSNSSGAWRFGGWELNLNSVNSGVGARQRYYITRSIASMTGGWAGATTRDFKFWSSGVFASRNLSHISSGQGNVRARIQFGNIEFEYSENPAFTKSGLAIEFLLDSGNYVVRLVYHDGTSYKTSDYHIINASTIIYNRHCAFVLRCNGGGEYSLWLNQAVDNTTLPVIPNPLTTAPVITITDGPTNLMGANPSEQFAFVKTNNSTSGGTSAQNSSRLMNWVMSIDN